MQSFKQLVENFKHFKNRSALSDFESKNSLTYRDLYEQVYLYVDKLSILKEGDRVVLYDIPSLDWVVLYFAIILSGGIVVPVDTRVSKSFLQKVLEEIDPRILISNSFRNEDIEVFTVQELQSRESKKMENPIDRNGSNKVSEIIFTSGTWGIPKGVMLSQKNILTNAHQILDIYHHKQEDTSLNILPLSHAYQQTAGLIVPLLVGSHVVFLDKPDSFRIVEAIKKYNIKTILVVPKVLKLIRSSILRKIQSKYLRKLFEKLVIFSPYVPFTLREVVFRTVRDKIGLSLESFVVGGALLSKDTDDFFQGLGYKVHIGYGLTETSPVISLSINQRREEGNVGRIVKGLKCVKNEKDELVVCGDNLFLGYYPNFRKDMEFNTGDMVNFNKNNDLIIKGRTKNLIIWPTGDKIFAEDLEYIISSLINIEDVCVVHEVKQDMPIIYCAVKSEQVVEIDLDYLHSKLPNNIKIEMIRIFSNDDFPFTHTLKPNRQKILEIFTK